MRSFGELRRILTRTGEDGFFLTIFVMWATFFLISLSAVGLSRSATDYRASTGVSIEMQAFQLAEGGLHDALAVLKTSSLKWDDELLGADGQPGTADDGVLPFGLVTAVTTPSGTYTVHIVDNEDESSPDPNDPTTDRDGIIRVVSTGTVGSHQRTITAWLWALFNHSIVAGEDILLRESTVIGSIHANHDIVVNEDSTLEAGGIATASGIFVLNGQALDHAGDDDGGDASLAFPHPDVAALHDAVTDWAPPQTPIITLADGVIAGYEEVVSTQRVAVDGMATLVVFNGHDVTFTQKMCGPDPDDPTIFNQMLSLSIIALGGGAITFQESSCIRGLIWAEGPITFAEDATVFGAIVSTGGTVSVDEKSSIGFNRDVIEASLLPGFAGFTVLLWIEE